MSENDSGVGGQPRAWVASVEVDGRQRYLFETDKLQEMVGASAIMRQLACEFDERAGKAGKGESAPAAIHVFQPASGEIRAWSTNRKALLHYAWEAREWLTERGVEHTVALLECRPDHFTRDKTPCEEEQARCARKEQEQDTDPDAGAGQFKSEPDWPDLSWVHGKLTDLARQVKNAKTGSDARPVCSLFEACRLHGFDFANEWIPQEENERESGREKRRALRGYRASEKWKARQDDTTRFVDEDVKRPLYCRSKALLEDEKCGETREAFLQRIEGYLKPDESKRDGPRDGQDSERVQRAIKIDDLVLRSAQQLLEGEDGTGRFVAFICADGDGMGRLLTGLDWNTAAWNARNADSPAQDDRNPTPWERNREFSLALDNVVRNAFRTAVAEVTLPDRKSLERLLGAAEKGKGFLIPVLPQLLGGDDLWTIARKDIALELCRTFASNVSTRVEESTILGKAMGISKKASGETVCLSMSVGIAFAKAGHPVHAMIDAAESLLASAKTLRKGTAWTLRKNTCWQRPEPNEGCIDWHWIESSLSETVGEARARGAAYVAPDTGDVMLLTTRPWTLTETEAFEKAAAVFESGVPGDEKPRGVPRRKREQLEDILRRGHVLSLVAWEAWWAGLHPLERRAVKAMSAAFPEDWRLPAPGCKTRAGLDAPKWDGLFDPSPWIYLGKDKDRDGEEKNYYVTPLIDLLTLHNLASSTGSESDQPSDGGIGEAEGTGEASGDAAGGTHG